MVDVKLFQALIAALRYSCRIIMVGDADQLPSVGPGNILGEIIRSGLVPTVCLNEIFRQAKRSLIVENAHHIISGEPLQKGGKTDDFFFLESDGDAAQRLVCDLVTTRLPRSYGFDPIRDIQVLCPTKLGPTGTQALNVELQNLLNPEHIGLSVKIYQGTGSSTLAKGAGHFTDTSIWDGTVALAGHNRGVNNHFGKIHTLEIGDKITLTTKLGTRTYKVTSVSKVSETDRSAMTPTGEDRIVLYTCVMNQSAYRWCVQATAV